jgi:LacI family kdg operon repressor
MIGTNRLERVDKMARVTMADVAKEAGVSKSTVSQFINKRYEYKLKAEANINDRHYRRKHHAQALNRGQPFD